MRLNNIRLLDTDLDVSPLDCFSARNRYLAKWNQLVRPNDWFNWSSISRFVALQYGHFPDHGFTMSVIGYDHPEGLAPGLDRREATSILRELGLRAPTHAEMFLFASEEIYLQRLVPILRQYGRRMISSPISINPEFPYQYSFGMRGVRGTM